MAELRAGKWEENEGAVEECVQDMKWEAGLQRRPGKLTKKQLVKTVDMLFLIEKEYLQAVLQLPWNKVGPEPFDTLIDVVWFRFGYSSVGWDWDNLKKASAATKKRFFKAAAIERKRAWMYRVHGVSTLKELEEAGEKVDHEDVRRVMGPISGYVDHKELRRKLALIDKRVTPSGLTKLLWSSLKWAQPSRWRVWETDTLSRRDREGDIFDENFPDPVWKELGDLQGRIVCPGEGLNRPLAHEFSGGLDVRGNLMVGEARRNDEGELEYNEWWLETYATQVLSLATEPERSNLIVAEFNEAVRSLPLSEIKRAVSRMDALEKRVVLHRLGYGADGYRPIEFVIGSAFDKSPHAYYECLKIITQKLSCT
ncbi:MAG: hypothetical protein UX92_C0014G0008 [Candidatus Amesbacteria bacterium GW2011_GWA1_47_20]|uniref:Uncharacterized protein n=2 Tax=Candidatus Amesiibacteriota TaxID=1752730 RepID=A0A0G1SI61_9BACT|nr:MAG: hypothetical protein UX42_C0003G0031 [Microgenomates group bacterium GW2011_GWC1_46_20]KKU69117.1 MAG: hypothetical protein UX92_C0014G0008 [Candidatus Amesbacteria bacterium GW2011_GWA1_47_20]KKU84033.1 MAG: hypothetical protein UY11_C0007G0012 [Candidatus Amesbacteria bacterium GW2011_GWC2_47_8]